jgi:hypothetical protein
VAGSAGLIQNPWRGSGNVWLSTLHTVVALSHGTHKGATPAARRGGPAGGGAKRGSTQRSNAAAPGGHALIASSPAARGAQNIQNISLMVRG